MVETAELSQKDMKTIFDAIVTTDKKAVGIQKVPCKDFILS